MGSPVRPELPRGHILTAVRFEVDFQYGICFHRYFQVVHETRFHHRRRFQKEQRVLPVAFPVVAFPVVAPPGEVFPVVDDLSWERRKDFRLGVAVGFAFLKISDV